MCACRVVSVTRSKARWMDEVFARAISLGSMCPMAFEATVHKSASNYCVSLSKKLLLLTTYSTTFHLTFCVFHFLCCDASHPQVSHDISGRVRRPAASSSPRMRRPAAAPAAADATTHGAVGLLSLRTW